MPDAAAYFRQSDPDLNPSFRGWHRAPLPRDAAALDRLADMELAHGHYRAADRLAWLAAGLREAAP
jgi:hypothetical protein